jgi:hypothetical protein
MLLAMDAEDPESGGGAGLAAARRQAERSAAGGQGMAPCERAGAPRRALSRTAAGRWTFLKGHWSGAGQAEAGELVLAAARGIARGDSGAAAIEAVQCAVSALQRVQRSEGVYTPPRALRCLAVLKYPGGAGSGGWGAAVPRVTSATNDAVLAAMGGGCEAQGCLVGCLQRHPGWTPACGDAMVCLLKGMLGPGGALTADNVKRALGRARAAMQRAGGAQEALRLWYASFGVEEAPTYEGQYAWPCFPHQLVAFAQRLPQQEAGAGARPRQGGGEEGVAGGGEEAEVEAAAREEHAHSG